VCPLLLFRLCLFREGIFDVQLRFYQVFVVAFVSFSDQALTQRWGLAAVMAENDNIDAIAIQ